MAIKCVFSGNVGQDAELRMLPSGGQVLSFPVATRKTWVTAAGVRQEKTTWIRCSVFGKRAAALAPLVTKGAHIFVPDAELTVSRKDTPEGPRDYWGVTVYDLEFGGAVQRDRREERTAARP